jgi:hypothetical protein
VKRISTSAERKATGQILAQDLARHRLAGQARSAFPEMAAHHHLTDAVSALDAGRPRGAEQSYRFLPLGMLA